MPRFAPYSAPVRQGAMLVAGQAKRTAYGEENWRTSLGGPLRVEGLEANLRRGEVCGGGLGSRAGHQAASDQRDPPDRANRQKNQQNTRGRGEGGVRGIRELPVFDAGRDRRQPDRNRTGIPNAMDC